MSDRFELDPGQMRSIGYQIVDLIVDHHAELANQRVSSKASHPEICAELPQEPPEHGRPFAEVLREIEEVVLGRRIRVDHPRFFGFVPSPSNFIGAMADSLAAGLNVFQGTWLASSGPSALELTVIDWMKHWIGYPPEAGGLFVSGGSVANLTALAAAREAAAGEVLANGVAYFSDQTHSSIQRAFRILGFAPERIRRLPGNDALRLPLEALRDNVSRDRAAGLRPFCVVANAGTTNSGAVDPLRQLAGFCREQGLWLHVDAAYGGAVVLCAEGKRALDGIELADSVSLDPHKWLFQPIESGCVLVREGRLLTKAFGLKPEYLQDVHRLEEVHFCDRGIQLTRGFRALKLWMTVHCFGMAAFRSAIERGFRLAELAQLRLEASGVWDIVTPAQLAIVSFRHRTSTVDLVEAMFNDGFAMLTSTVIRSEPALRLCTINPRTTEDDIAKTIDKLETLAQQV